MIRNPLFFASISTLLFACSSPHSSGPSSSATATGTGGATTSTTGTGGGSGTCTTGTGGAVGTGGAIPDGGGTTGSCVITPAAGGDTCELAENYPPAEIAKFQAYCTSLGGTAGTYCPVTYVRDVCTISGEGVTLIITSYTDDIGTVADDQANCASMCGTFVAE